MEDFSSGGRRRLPEKKSENFAGWTVRGGCGIIFVAGGLQAFFGMIGYVHCLFFLVLAFAWELRGAQPLVTIENCVLVPTDWADGDSFEVRTPDRKTFTVRLYGADCLECHVNDESNSRRLRAQRRYFGITKAGSGAAREAIEIAKGFGERATEMVREKLAKPFTVHTAFSDARGDGKYKRYYGFITTADGKDLAAELVKAGLARAYGVNRERPDGVSGDDYRENLEDYELQAASGRRGVWKITDWESLPAERQLQRQEDGEIALGWGKLGLGIGETLDPNSAARDDLMRIPGIGETLANRVIEGRPYGKPDDLLEVDGIGKTTFEKMRPFLEISEAK